MQVVLLYGPPGVGKYTVGMELARRTGFKFLHNHLTVNLVSAVFERDTDVWGQLLRRIRVDIMREAARHHISLILTLVYDGATETTDFWRTLIAPVSESGGSALFVKLSCERSELFKRVQMQERVALHKLVDTRGLEELMARRDFHATAPFTPHLSLDITHMSPAAAAAAVIAHFELSST